MAAAAARRGPSCCGSPGRCSRHDRPVRPRHAEHGPGLRLPAGREGPLRRRPGRGRGLLEIYPPLPAGPGEPGIHHEAVTWAARQGIGQFIDLGAGLPASPSVHQAARAVLPTARVAYVDIDPVVLSHARALLATGDGVIAVERGPA